MVLPIVYNILVDVNRTVVYNVNHVRSIS